MRRTHLIAVLGMVVISIVVTGRSADLPPPKTDTIGVFFSPNGGCTDAIVHEIALAKISVRIQAYSFTSAPIAKAIIDAKKRGVKVEAVLDKSNRTEKYSAATFLKNQGCDVLIDAKHAIAHNKIIIIDEKVIITGSFNFSKAAEESNAENLLVIRDEPQLVAKYVANFRLHQQHSESYQGTVGAVASDEKPLETPKGKFVGSKKSDLYHYPSCSAVKTISPNNMVEYNSAPPGKRLHEGCSK